MENKEKDLLEQYEFYCMKKRQKILKSKELKNIFKLIYALNYLRNRVELRDLFNETYFKYSYSALLESFDLLSNNYTRASLLVLRSSIESFLKFIINCFSDEYEVHHKVYNENKKTVDIIINEKINKNFQTCLISANSKLETSYGKISKISHSISKDIEFFNQYLEDLETINEIDIQKIILEMENVISSYYIFCIALCRESFYHWDTDHLESMFRFVYGKRKTDRIITSIKEIS